MIPNCVRRYNHSEDDAQTQKITRMNDVDEPKDEEEFDWGIEELGKDNNHLDDEAK